MRSVAMKWVSSLICWLIAPAYAGELIGDLLPRINLPDACETKCRNGDGDPLFPQGTINGSCVLACRGIPGASPPSPGVRPSRNNRAFVLLEGGPALLVCLKSSPRSTGVFRLLWIAGSGAAPIF